jgi:hypothetical protein
MQGLQSTLLLGAHKPPRGHLCENRTKEAEAVQHGVAARAGDGARVLREEAAEQEAGEPWRRAT